MVSRLFQFIALISMLTLSSPPVATAAEDQNSTIQAILHILDYIAVDYPQVIIHGEIINAGEYQEQREFSAAAQAKITKLPDHTGKAAMVASIQQLVALIGNRASGQDVQTLCRDLSAKIVSAYHVSVAPPVAPSLKNASILYQNKCAECHGALGYGNGPRAAKLDHPPINFHDPNRQSQRSIFSLYNSISLGINDTPMRSFTELSESQRWALAFYVSNFFATDAERARGELLRHNPEFRNLFSTLDALTQAMPAQYGDDGNAVLAYLRSHPETILIDAPKPLDISRQKLADSSGAYKSGDFKYAKDLAVSAYLDGFELVETPLSEVDKNLKLTIESAMTRYRQDITAGIASPEEIAQEEKAIQSLLDKADSALHSDNLPPSMGFTSALIILLREGLEAILVLAAIISFLIKTDRRDAVLYVHMGWITALLAGIVTWYVTKEIIDYSSVSRTLTEGFTALFAAAMLLYVGYWLHNHTNSDRWRTFIHGRIHDSISTGTVWGLVLISFVAVYREVAETVLFYETLWLQTAPGNYGYLVGGLLSASLILLAMGWFMFRISVRLPLRQFFRVNAALLTVLAIIFAGKGIAALQEAGKLRIDPINFPEIHLLGIYPTLESLGLQLSLVTLVIAWLIYSRSREQTTL